MFDYIVTLFLFLLGALLAVNSFKKWRSLRSLWYLFATVLFLAAAIFMVFDWGSGGSWMVIGMIVYLVGQASAKRNAKS